MNRCLNRGALLFLLALACGLALAGEAFMTTAHGARYKDLQPGSGAAVRSGDVVTMHFTGWLDDNGSRGREIYNTRRDGKPVSFVVGSNRVMPGWNDGVIGMRQGGRRLLMVPPALAYGNKGVGDIIPPNAGMIFVIELVELEKPGAGQPGG